MDYFIKSAVVALPSYVRDSIDFIDTLKKFEVKSNVLLATLDVQSVYTNNPHDGGISAVKHFLTLNQPESKLSIDCILDLACIALTNNIFQFQDNFYIQRKGTAIVSKMAPNYACLYMGLFENN